MSAKYELIDAEKANYAIIDMCAWLQVSRSGYYRWAPAHATMAGERLSSSLAALLGYSIRA